MAIKKQYLKNSDVCKVTFRVPKEVGKAHNTASVLGDFNSWSGSAAEMTKLKKDGSFSTVLEIEKGKSYQFRYLLDGKVWYNDEEADATVTSPYGDSENAVLDLRN